MCQMLPAVMLAMAAFMAMLGSVRGSAVDLRPTGTGMPALTHMAAALALAISSNWSLSEDREKTARATCHCLLVMWQS